ncbi:amidase [Beijerinckia sp. L45]|uniref:amidase n=1 Tax=Beijerinckia sp. L45 TaxID=1641855 RepID=UPI00131E6625|nr:amidase [Beijerinckia sp. L45]
MRDSVGAFCPNGVFEIPGAATGPLAGLSFAVKDFIDIAGHVTGCGNPRWLETHEPAVETAPSVSMLLAAGAHVVGKTISDELAYGLNGDNVHYGTPVNVNAPGRVPGGSSSGSAAAVAAGLCDFALGTDTGGSVRIPASFCGVFGIRTTHGLIPLQGVVPFMPHYDTLGWFARSGAMMARVGAILLPPRAPTRFKRIILVEDALVDAAPELVADTKRLLHALSALLDLQPESRTIADAEGLEAGRLAYRTTSAAESWRVHGAWIDGERPGFGAPIKERFEYAKAVSPADDAAAAVVVARIRARLLALVADDALLVMPTAPGPAPLLDASGPDIEQFRQRLQRMTSIAGLGGLPEVTVPRGTVDGLPVGLSMIGPPGSDAALLDLCARLV